MIAVARTLLALALVVGCAVPTRVDTLGPDFDGTRTLRMRGNVLPTPVDGIGAVELNAERVERADSSLRFALLVEVRAEGLEIREGESLRLVVDADTFRLRRDSLVNFWPRVDPAVREQARYPAPDSVLRRLGAAGSAAVAVQGAGWWERRRLSPRNLEVLRSWVEMYVPADTVGADAADGRDGNR